MDRLICGDVGFGKTEVALRAAFVAAMNGKQVAVVVPTTLLARQHFRLSERFAACPSRSRSLAPRRRRRTGARGQEGLADGASTSSSAPMRCWQGIKFKDLGLVVVDEEQHFGVAHKERLKQLRAEVHVLTLTATPIPRTLQLALSGVRDLSIIATPPVDRLAVRTFVSPFDPLVVREALLREHYRGGQSFYVCPRIEDLAASGTFLDKRRAGGEGRGRARPDGADRARRRDDGVLRRQIRRAAVDQHRRIRPRHSDRQHADRAPRRHVRLSQLYQLRGRVGRSKLRAYAYLTLPPTRRSRRRRERGSRCCNRSTRWAPASSSPATISTSAAPAICWATSSPAISRKSASSSTSRCWRRRSGPKGGTIAFRGNAFTNPAALIAFINQHGGTMRVRPDQKIVVTRDWATPEERLSGAKALLTQLVNLAK
jgi:transcription-repair coupling factor (superfamily II helicase)